MKEAISEKADELTERALLHFSKDLDDDEYGRQFTRIAALFRHAMHWALKRVREQ